MTAPVPALNRSTNVAGALPLPVLLLVALLGSTPSLGLQLRMKRVMFLSPSTSAGGGIYFHPVCDLNRDGLSEMTYGTGRFDSMVTNPMRWEILQFLPWRHSRILQADTAPPWQSPPGFYPGYLIPGAAGDGDRDGLYEVWGYNFLFTDTTPLGILCTYEQGTPTALPDSCTWHHVIGQLFFAFDAPTDLDGDSLADMPILTDDYPYGLVLENRGDNRYVAAWAAPYFISAQGLAFADCDMDGRTEFMGGTQYWTGQVMVWEATADNHYECVWQDSVHLPNGGVDCFTGRDVNQNGRPEFFMHFYRYLGLTGWMCYLYMWEAVGNNSYTRVLVDSASENIGNPGRRSLCGDIDGDGIQEVCWATGTFVRVYKAAPGSGFEKVYEWVNDHNLQQLFTVTVNVADVDYNGYDEILAGSYFRLSVLGVEAIRVIHPNAGSYYPGDTCRIGWETFNPPGCDSVSLFLKTDTAIYPPHLHPLPSGGRGERRGGDAFWKLDTIATGLAPADTPYLWVVPDIRAESAWVLAVAYGPGWQYDESDSAIRILGTGAVEEKPVPVYETRLAVFPNPSRGRLVVEYGLAAAGPVELVVLDATGRKVATLASGGAVPGAYKATWAREGVASGVYFLRLDTGRERRVVKVVAE